MASHVAMAALNGVSLATSSLQWEDSDPRDDRDWIAPDLSAELTSADYAANIDPAMEAIEHNAFVPIEQSLEPAIRANDVVALHALYDGYFKKPMNEFAQTQFRIEDLGQRLLGNKQNVLAQSILRWNAERSPGSSRARDAMCDAYLPSSELSKAKSCFQGVLRVFPTDKIAASRLSNLAAGLTPDT